MLRAVVEDSMNRIEPQAIEMELLNPVESVMDDKLAHRAAVGPVKIDRGAPRCAMTIGKGLRRDRMDVRALWAEMIVNDVEQHHQPARVRRFHQIFQVLGPAIG